MTFVRLNEVIGDAFVVQLGKTFPSLFYQITYGGQAVAFTAGSSVVFFMRPILSRTPVINAASAVPLNPPDSDGNNARYDWQTSDVALEGQYMGWWGYEFPGSTLAETPEFPIVVTDHGPGYGVQTGPIVDALYQHMPITVTALRRDEKFGDRFLQVHADYVKRVVLGAVVPPDQESQFDPLVIEYLSKRTAIRLINPAKDYWGRQYTNVMTQGPSESATYPNMLANLDALHERLCHEVIEEWRQLRFLVPGLPQLRVEPAPASSLGDPQTNFFSGPVTPDPHRNPRQRTGGPRWGSLFE